MNAINKPVIIYAEDDFDDFDALKEALEQISHNYNLIHAKNGNELIAYLENEANEKLSLIVLDLNMPIMDGKQALQWLKQHPEHKEIPIMIFTTSSREEDIRLCKNYECTFFRKPTLYRDLLHVVQVMLQMCVSKAV